MKNKFVLPCVFTLGFLLLGAGCSTATNTAVNTTNTQPVVETNTATPDVTTPTDSAKTWLLSFDLPEGWIMTEGCPLDGEKVRCDSNLAGNDDPAQVPKIDFEVDPNADIIYLQNTTKIPLFGGIAPGEAVKDLYQGENVAMITVTHIASEDYGNFKVDSNGVPNYGIKTEDLGNGFYKVTTCDLVASPECEIYGQSAYEYYLITKSGEQFQFHFITDGVSGVVIKDIILSAKE